MAFIHRTASGALIVGFANEEIGEKEVRLTHDNEKVNQMSKN